jgi:hypothetical protein
MTCVNNFWISYADNSTAGCSLSRLQPVWFHSAAGCAPVIARAPVSWAATECQLTKEDYGEGSNPHDI